MEEEINKIEIRSEEVQEILGRSPRWIIRWGITVVFIVVAIIFVGSYFFKYPDIVNSNITITTENLPANIVAKTSGKLEYLYVKDKQKVKEGDWLAIIENHANTEHMKRLKMKLDSISFIQNFQKLDSVELIKNIVFTENYILGDLQSPYISLLKGVKDYQIFLESNFQNKKIKSIQEQINKYNALYGKMVKQTKIMDEQLDLAKMQYTRDSSLFKSSSISKMEFEKSRSTMLQSKYSYETSKSNLDNTKITISQLEQSILDLQQQYIEQRNQYQSALTSAYDILNNQIKTWELTYALRSPIDGIVTFNQYWNINQNIKLGDNVLTIIPNKEKKIIGKIKLAMQGAGKVKVGQKVNIKFVNYPYMEYGIVRGIIKTISLIPIESNYTVEVEFPQGLKTNYNKTLVFTQEMQGSAEIITEDIRLIERFLNPLKAVWKKNF